jgi:PleD family two-component response regulator
LGTFVQNNGLTKRRFCIFIENKVQKERNRETIDYFTLGGVQVLVVDDSKANLIVVRGLLAPYGLSPDTAVSGEEAIEKVNRNLLCRGQCYC